MQPFGHGLAGLEKPFPGMGAGQGKKLSLFGLLQHHLAVIMEAPRAVPVIEENAILETQTSRTRC